eukprot:TRINITY_DN1646_c0_g1_i9.p1 TRINITY_DN1646_c0_g1~~TRINITY_DN1646_c0_g1_i9.p1  ORF type:complete len:371 (-),score=66.16 TRINITY_DN1646_c0_g1_i9:122-1234(-)
MNGHLNEAPGRLLQAVIEKSIKEGRGGLGSIYVWASGNDAAASDQCNFDGYANMRYSILIGSSSEDGSPSRHSEPCAALSAVAPGSGKDQIRSTDLMGPNGLSVDSDCTSFSGTSASCPMAAGMVALILNVVPSLTWLEVQYVMKASSRKHIDHPSWVKNGAGNWHSPFFGFGLLDAGLAVDTALEWKAKNMKVTEIVIDLTSDEPSWDVTKITVDQSNMTIHHVEVWLWTTHEEVSSTRISLESPQGTASLLAWEHLDQASKWDGWRFLSRAFWGENPLGTWVLRITDQTREKEVITRWRLALYGNQTVISKDDGEVKWTGIATVDSELNSSSTPVPSIFSEDIGTLYGLFLLAIGVAVSVFLFFRRRR